MKIDPIPVIKIDSITPPGLSKSPKKMPMKYLKLGLILLAILAFLNIDTISDYYVVQTYSGDRELVSLSDQAGLSLEGKALFLSKEPELLSANQLYTYCPREEGVFGCYLPAEDKIYILQISTDPYSKVIPSTIAHEMLHIAWEEMAVDERAEVASLIEQHMDESSDTYTDAVKKILTDYDDDGAIQVNEAHSFIGSELFEHITDDALDGHYRKYLSDRDRSAHSNEEYVKGVKALEFDLSSRTAALETKFNELQDYNNRWLRSFDQAFERDRYYGNYQSYNINVERYNNNLKTYNGMVDAYEKERIRLQADIDKYNSVMEEIRPDKQIKSIGNQAKQSD